MTRPTCSGSTRTSSRLLDTARASAAWRRIYCAQGRGRGVISSPLPFGRGRIASLDAIRVRGLGLSIDRDPSPQPRERASLASDPASGRGGRACRVDSVCKIPSRHVTETRATNSVDPLSRLLGPRRAELALEVRVGVLNPNAMPEATITSSCPSGYRRPAVRPCRRGRRG